MLRSSPCESSSMCGGEENDLDQRNLQMNLSENMLIRLWQMSIINSMHALHVPKSFLGKAGLWLKLEERDFVNGNCTTALIPFGVSLLEAEVRESERERPSGMIHRWDNINNDTTRAAPMEILDSSPVFWAARCSRGWETTGKWASDKRGPQSSGWAQDCPLNLLK